MLLDFELKFNIHGSGSMLYYFFGTFRGDGIYEVHFDSVKISTEFNKELFAFPESDILIMVLVLFGSVFPIIK